jgi:hypothetical protein
MLSRFVSHLDDSFHFKRMIKIIRAYQKKATIRKKANIHHHQAGGQHQVQDQVEPGLDQVGDPQGAKG